ncbi:MAG: gamma carbonic anhydrase family protein [Pseudomonadota bacterium]
MFYDLGTYNVQTPADGDFWVAPGAHVLGQVVLGAATSVWFGAVLRGDNEPITLGAGSNVQENAILHTDMGYPLTIGQNCTIGHGAMLHGCTIGNGSLIGMGAIVLNGAQIGQGCQIGAGALVPEGKVIPDGALVMGIPGKIVRLLDADAQKGLIQSAIGYQNNMRRVRTELIPMP